MLSIFQNFVQIDYKTHLLISLVIRLVLMSYGLYHDSISDVPYTDIDYKVFTDAARHVLNGNSPYDRHTYRYSPLVAVFLVPNILIWPCFGKVFFSFVDIIVALLIRLIVKNTLKEYDCYKQKMKKIGHNQNEIKPKEISYRCRKKSKQSNKKGLHKEKSEDELWADISMLIWLYNPITVAISTRGNCDALACFFVLITLYVLQCKRQIFIAGLMHGLSIHFRLYPIIYSLTYFMYLSKYSYYTTEDRRSKSHTMKTGKGNMKKIKNIENSIVQNANLGEYTLVPYHNKNKERKTIFKREYLFYLIPNVDQSKLVSGCLISFSVLTGFFYYLYGYKFLYETYIYHLIRKDTRHNFSLYFYLQYLTAWVKNIGVWQKVLMILPQIVLLLVFSVRYGLNKFALNFAVLTETIVMVIYNGVLTSQYFVWIMAILPLCIWQIQMPKKTAIFLLVIWFVAQGAWLFPAYLLEFQGQNTFLFIWIQSVSFFCANVAILGRFIMYFMQVKEKAV